MTFKKKWNNSNESITWYVEEEALKNHKVIDLDRIKTKINQKTKVTHDTRLLSVKFQHK